jgi:hypothetical protein
MVMELQREAAQERQPETGAFRWSQWCQSSRFYIPVKIVDGTTEA